MGRKQHTQRFVASIATFAVLILGCLLMPLSLVAQPTLELVAHNVTQRCPEAGKSYSAKIKINGGDPVAGTPPFFRYLVTDDGVTEVSESNAEGEVNQGEEKEFPLVRGKSLLWIFDKESKAYPFQLADYIKDGGGNLLPIPATVVLKPENVVLDSVLCHGGSSGIISLREAGKDVRYILFQSEEGSDPTVQTPTDVVKGVSGKGVFKGLIAGVYKLWVEDANQCLYHYDRLFTLHEPEAGDFDAAFVGVEKVKCPGDLVERVSLSLRGGSGKFLRFSWLYTDVVGQHQDTMVTTQPVLDSVAPGDWSVSMIDSKGCEFTKALTVPGVRGYALKIPPTVIEPAACQLYNENEEISRGKISNITIEGGASSSNRRYVWGEVPEVVRELTGQTVNVGSATPYELPHGDYQILIAEGGCQTKFHFNMPYNDTNQPTLELVGIPPIVCYGAEISFRMNLTKATLFKNDPKYTFTVLHDLDGDKEVRGRVIDLGGYSYRLESHVYDRTSVGVAGVSTSGCIVFDRREIRVIPPASFDYDPNVSHAGVLFNGKVIDSVRSRNLGKDGEVIKYKDSLALGVLEGTTTEVGFLVAGGGDYKVVLDIRPDGILIPSRTGKAYLYDLHLPTDAFTNEKYKVVTVSRNGYTYDFLRLNTNLIYTVQNSKQTCINDRYLYIRLVDKLRIPNVFTPNGDGVNDRWLYNGDETNVNLYSHLQDLLPNLEVEVFTRTGVSVWYAKGAGIGKGWDGTQGGKGGAALPTGTYYYVIRFNAPGGGKKWKPISGSVTIVR